MNRSLTMTLLVAGLTCNVFVFGQVKSGRTQLPPLVLKSDPVLVAPGFVRPAPLFMPLPGGRPVIAPVRVVPHDDSIRILRPDNMPCLVTKVMVEPIPVKILHPREPMPVKQ
ncbi:hypothetical protein Q4E93_32035 [Flavitalea sp. BT771]|uniref:hypothetical protein n=1 Tax=Flavitalea sp. BT771 TaxID=3063329 RepID=UPI0026E46B77|nr:hypothetical protein [Flavitalea sp. BT771]MDO6435291.1 hypothetical protein [Flavitalea sp. BT771]MDV6224349.1 hypothetical protein [Flavitalea sp. BT771]